MLQVLYYHLAMASRAGHTIPTLLADDEPLAREELTFLLKQFPDIEVLGAASNGLETLEMVEELEPELVFLDVQMPGLDGLATIRRVREKHPANCPYFVLVTAFDSYAIEAFEVEAMDYLLKPVDKERLEHTIERVRRYLSERQAPAQSEPPTPKPALQRNKVLVKSGSRNFIVDAQDIIYATIEDGLITVVASNLEGQSNYRTIEELQSNLDPEIFWRAHRSYLVNINRIREVVPWFKSSYQLRMDDKRQTEIPVSRVQTKRLRALLKL
ncbi:MAG: LytTR family DNA-binding domain-containing protein [Bryobacteraceae bacterium]|nr:LytTR family DNA-binding domain-containing protein [Bryobacteraceae bacterium]MDW8379635.1 LytTR family DNA-binding domain-containing protein [Bryobacterales bacterium]